MHLQNYNIILFVCQTTNQKYISIFDYKQFKYGPLFKGLSYTKLILYLLYYII